MKNNFKSEQYGEHRQVTDWKAIIIESLAFTALIVVVYLLAVTIKLI